MAIPDSEHVHIFDTTLRDGEQSPGVFFSPEDKLEIAWQLNRLGVDVIEAGMPVNSPYESAGVELVANNVEGPVIAGLARTQVRDINAAFEAVKGSERPRIHTFISTSDIHIEHQLQTTRDHVLGEARAAVAHAVRLMGEGGEVEFSPMDATRAEIAFTAEVCRAAIEEGASIINIPDTVGYAMPDEYRTYLEELYDRIPELHDVTLSVHCHQDLGMAVANSYMGLLAGARQVECAVNGIGERAGNSSLEEIVMAIKVREGLHGFHTGIDTRELMHTSQLVSRLSGMPVQPNKAVVGANAFKHESGIHADGVMKNPMTYEIMEPEAVGADPTNKIVLGKHSGRHAVREAFELLGFPAEQSRPWFEKRFQPIANSIGAVPKEILEAIARDEILHERGPYRLVSFEAGSSKGTHRAEVAIELPSGETAEATVEQTTTEKSIGSPDGAVSALFASLRQAAEVEHTLDDYVVRLIGNGGETGIAEATIKLHHEGRPVIGIGISMDVLEASAKAYVNAMSEIARRVEADSKE
jgi:2-isopropylmalate synthase